MNQDSSINDQINDLDQQAKAKQAAADFGLEFITLDDKDIQLPALSKIDKKLALEYQLIPVRLEGKALTIAVADTSLLTRTAPAFLQDLKKQGFSLNVKIITSANLNKLIKVYDQPSTPTIGPKITPNKPVTPNSQSANIGSDVVDLEVVKIPDLVLKRFPEDVARRYKMVVFAISPDEKEISVAAEEPDDPRVKDILGFIEKRNKAKVKLYKTTTIGLNKALEGYKIKTEEEKEKQSPIEKPKAEETKPSLAIGQSTIQTTQDKEVLKTQPDLKATPTPQTSPQTTDSIKNDQAGSDLLRKLSEQTTKETNKTEETQSSAIPQIEIGQIMQTVPEAESAPPTVIAGQEEDDLTKMLGGTVDVTAVLERHIKSGIIPQSTAALIAYAVNLGASDVHIEGQEKNLRIRYRIDGLLRNIITLPKELLAPIVSRIKILSRLKIDETRLPQDGRFGVVVESRPIDLRVSTLPTTQGEKVVMRILDKTTGLKKVTDLGLIGNNLTRVNQSLENPYGIIFVTGPTGSGKTTTLYAILNDLNKTEVNITTLEDPVEYQLNGINQTQIKAKIGYSFADGLRSIVRQDPDIIMVGEVRDSETATLATQAALTGHLVLSTLHTNDAAGAIPRLIDMDVEPFLLSSSINIVVAQRLVRQLCSSCKVAAAIPEEVLTELKQALATVTDPEFQKLANLPMKFFDPKGCEKCNNGYKGRIGIFEVLPMSEAISKLTIAKAAAADIESQALKEGMIKMRQDGIVKAMQGITSLNEVLRVTAK